MTARLFGPDRPKVAADLRARYEAGDTIRAVAAAAGISYSAARDLLREAGTVLRPKGVARGSRRGADR